MMVFAWFLESFSVGFDLSDDFFFFAFADTTDWLFTGFFEESIY